MSPESGARAAETAPDSNNKASTAIAKSTYFVEVLPRMQFAERLAIRSSLELEPVSHSDAFLAIGTTLAAAMRFGAEP